MMDLSEISVSPCETHHLKDGKPFYEKKFLKVLKYHEPGLAPVLDTEGAYHIDLKGNPAYSPRFQRSFGFYHHRAAVELSGEAFHILPDGSLFYPQRYSWCGNFQEGFCVVRNFQNHYFHITLEGTPLYPCQYAYVGDFKDGMAVICNEKGLHTHINSMGQFIHSRWFCQLDIFHKSFARAKDEQGWSYIDRQGNFIDTKRYAAVEPFYNGIAYVEDFHGKRLLINEEGEIVKTIYEPPYNDRHELSALSHDMVGFWKTWALYSAVELNIPNFLPGYLDEIATEISVPISKLRRLFKALWEMKILQPTHNDYWELTDKGKFLQPATTSFMAAASLMWGEVNKAWQNLPTLIRKTHDFHHTSFKEREENESLLATYHRALDGYAQKDFLKALDLSFWQNHKNLLGFGRCSLTLLSFLLEKYVHLNAKVVGTEKGLGHFDIPSVLKDRFQKDYPNGEVSGQNQGFSWADAFIFPRFLHYFPSFFIPYFCL